MRGRNQIQVFAGIVLILTLLPLRSLSKEQPYIRTTAASIAENPGQFLGKRVKIETEVKEVYSLNTLGLVGSDRAAREAAVNVVIPYRSTASVLEGDKVTIHGIVRRFEPQKLKQEFEWFNTSWFDRPNLVARWPSKPMIIAHSVQVPSGANLVQKAPEDDPGLRPVPEGQVKQPQ